MTIILNGTQGTTTPGLYSSTTFTGTYADGIVADYTTGLGRISVGSADGLAFYNGGVATTELMRLDSSGNLGLGVAPSAWGTNKAIQFGAGGLNGSVYAAASGVVGLTSNFYNNGSDLYIANGYATRYYQYAGQHVWNTAPSGTAGNAISFTQAMALDASGNLLVGTTGASYSAANRGLIEVNGSSESLIALKIGGGTTNATYQYNTTAAFETNVTGSRYCAWGVNGSERMRIDSSGNLLVGRTTQISDATVSIDARSGRPLATYVSGTGSLVAASFHNPNGQVGYISTNGTATTYSTSSDYRLKENIQPMQNALARNALLKPVTYQWKSDKSQGEGFIAHELQEIVPSCVTGEKDAVDAEGKPVYQGIDTSFLVGHLVACINELKAELDELKAKVNA